MGKTQGAKEMPGQENKTAFQKSVLLHVLLLLAQFLELRVQEPQECSVVHSDACSERSEVLLGSTSFEHKKVQCWAKP